MNNGIQFWAAIAGMLGMLIALLHLLRDLFDIRLGWLPIRDSLKRNAGRISLVAALILVGFALWSLNTSVQKFESQVAEKDKELSSAYATQTWQAGRIATLESETLARVTSVPVSQWCDDFGDARLDESRWLPSTNENLIYERDGVLNLINKLKAEETVGASLHATGTGRQIREVSFTITLESYEGDVSGGAGLGVYLEGGRDLYVQVGPGPNGPGVEFSICRNPPCSGDYNEYEHPDGGAFPAGVRTPMRVVWTGEKVEFYINNVLRIEQSTDPRPMVELLFAMYADPGSVYHAMVDDVCVVYVN